MNHARQAVPVPRTEAGTDETVYRLRTGTVELRVCDPPTGAEEVTDPHRAARLARAVLDELDADQEHFVVFALDTKNRPRAVKVLFSGGMTQSIVDPRVVYRWALLFGASHLLAAHNHPSGDPTPSEEDRRITERLKQAGKALGLELIDHIILGAGEFYAMAGDLRAELDRTAQ